MNLMKIRVVCCLEYGWLCLYFAPKFSASTGERGAGGHIRLRGHGAERLPGNVGAIASWSGGGGFIDNEGEIHVGTCRL